MPRDPIKTSSSTDNSDFIFINSYINYVATGRRIVRFFSFFYLNNTHTWNGDSLPKLEATQLRSKL